MGVGLHEKQAERDWSEKSVAISDYGVEKFIDEKLRLESGGTALGFEVIGFGYGLECTWLCSGLEREMFCKFDIRPNEYGLIDTYAQAQKVHDWILEDEQKGIRAEPIPYNFWLIVKYPLSIGDVT